ncbi:MAG TPA: AAA family ATPase, partial [Polyangium sp.]|nr:AAA family ATPase [Polyangium sp.]
MPHVRDCVFGETLHLGVDTWVRRATHTPSGAAWVVKMTVAATNSQRAMGRLVHEERMLVKLASIPGVVRSAGLEQDGLQVALFLEDQRLQSLDRVLLEHGRLSLREALHVGLETSRVLENVHAVGVVHKDVKPQNLLWDEKNHRVTLLDFAIASELAEEATSAAIPEALEGTLAYMSPEQTGRMARGIDARTDLYSLGVVLFELLCGHRPFVETDPLALVHAHLAKPVPELLRLVGNLPPVVVRIVERCLEKHPEKRYQTAHGLAADLNVCLEQLEVLGRIDDFILGQKDYSPVLHLPQTLVSRENEVVEIQGAFERAARGSVELLLLSGPSGVGKTALMRSVYEKIAKAGRGLLLSGKHDQLGRSVPFAALAQAFGGFVRDVAASSKSVFDAWRKRIDSALGPLARMIADVVPELEWLMGEIPALPVVTSEMTYNRVKLAWIEFVRVIADKSPPLVLFLDDLQWVDPASLEMLKVVLTDVARKNLLVIAAYRDNEVDAAHPLWTLVEAVDKTGIAVSRLSVGPLDENAVSEWLALALALDKQEVAALARVLRARTHGNPFFLGQLLLELHRQKCVHRDGDTGAWAWDQDAVERAAVTDNVVELMQKKVVELPLDTQTLLGRAACAGHTFSLSELSVLSGCPASLVARDLHPALLTGLVVPLDGHYREAHALSTSSSAVEATYRFLHDRVQQAFYERIDPERRTQSHLVLGRRLQKAFERDGGSNQKFLEFVRHLNLGAPALTTELERRDLARLDLQATKAAKVNGSYQLQASLVEQAQALLGPNAWQDERDLSIDLALERIEADYMLREFGEVHRRVRELLALPLPKVARLTAQALQQQCLEVSAQFAEGERLGLQVLAEYGDTFPDSNEACTMQCFVLLVECQEWLDDHPEGFSRMPLETSVEYQLLDAVEASVTNCVAFGSRPTLAGLIAIRNVHKVLERGTLTPTSPYFISSTGSLRSIILGRFREDVCWTQAGLAAAQRLSSPYLAQCMYLDAFYIPHRAPMGPFRDVYKSVIRTGLAVGSFQGTSWGLMGEIYCMDFWPGLPLSFVAEQIAGRRESMTRYGDIMGQHGLDMIQGIVDYLRTPKNAQPPTNSSWLAVGSEYLAQQRDNYIAELARVEEA